jgi:hypothetical protein
MAAIPIKPKSKAQLEWEREDYEKSVAAIRRGHEDVKAGRTRPAAKFLEELRERRRKPTSMQ